MKPPVCLACKWDSLLHLCHSCPPPCRTWETLVWSKLRLSLMVDTPVNQRHFSSADQDSKQAFCLWRGETTSTIPHKLQRIKRQPHKKTESKQLNFQMPIETIELKRSLLRGRGLVRFVCSFSKAMLYTHTFSHRQNNDTPSCSRDHFG